jgi:hypothetical protein
MQVSLGGGGSAPSGLRLSYAWSQLSGPAVTINNSNQPAADFTPTSNVAENTNVTLQLRVNDTHFNTDDTVVIELHPMVDSDGDGLSDQEELTGRNNSLTTADPGGRITDPNVADSDGDGVNDGDEALAGTDPNSAASVFAIHSVERNGSSVTITWRSIAGRFTAFRRRLNRADLGATQEIRSQRQARQAPSS